MHRGSPKLQKVYYFNTYFYWDIFMKWFIFRWNMSFNASLSIESEIYIFPYVSIYRLSTFTRRVYRTSSWWGYSSSTPRARLSAPQVTTAVIFPSTFRVNCEFDLMCEYLKTGNVKRLLKPDSSLWLIAWIWDKGICWQVIWFDFLCFKNHIELSPLECVFNIIDCLFCARFNDVLNLCCVSFMAKDPHNRGFVRWRER